MCVFSKTRHEEWNCILLREKKVIFVLELIVSRWKNKGQTNMNTESDRGLWKRNPEKRVLCTVGIG